jgi:hypothetical protein
MFQSNQNDPVPDPVHLSGLPQRLLILRVDRDRQEDDTHKRLVDSRGQLTGRQEIGAIEGGGGWGRTSKGPSAATTYYHTPHFHRRLSLD